MFKPMKLSSAQTDEAATPEKQSNQDLLIDITLDLCERELKAVHILETLVSNSSKNQPTIIDLRFNCL